MLRASVRQVMADRYPIERVARSPTAQGSTAPSGSSRSTRAGPTSRCPEDEGGAGLGFVEEMIVAEELGRALYPGPVPGVGRDGAADPPRRAAPPTGPRGRAGRADRDRGVRRRRTRSDRRWATRLTGTWLFVPNLDVADAVIVVVPAPGDGDRGRVARRDGDADGVSTAPLLPRRRAPSDRGELIAGRRRRPPAARRRPRDIGGARDRALAALAAEACGVAATAPWSWRSRTRKRAQAVRPRHRFVPGRLARAGAGLHGRGDRAVPDLLGGVGGRRRDDPEAPTRGGGGEGPRGGGCRRRPASGRSRRTAASGSPGSTRCTASTSGRWRSPPRWRRTTRSGPGSRTRSGVRSGAPRHADQARVTPVRRPAKTSRRLRTAGDGRPRRSAARRPGRAKDRVEGRRAAAAEPAAGPPEPRARGLDKMRLTGDRLLVRLPEDRERRSKAGLLIPATAAATHKRCIWSDVVMVGPGHARRADRRPGPVRPAVRPRGRGRRATRSFCFANATYRRRLRTRRPARGPVSLVESARASRTAPSVLGQAHPVERLVRGAVAGPTSSTSSTPAGRQVLPAPRRATPLRRRDPRTARTIARVAPSRVEEPPDEHGVHVRRQVLAPAPDACRRSRLRRRNGRSGASQRRPQRFALLKFRVATAEGTRMRRRLAALRHRVPPLSRWPLRSCSRHRPRTPSATSEDLLGLRPDPVVAAHPHVDAGLRDADVPADDPRAAEVPRAHAGDDLRADRAARPKIKIKDVPADRPVLAVHQRGGQAHLDAAVQERQLRARRRHQGRRASTARSSWRSELSAPVAGAAEHPHAERHQVQR